MGVLVVVLVAVILIIVLVVRYKKNKPAPPVPPVPPVTPGSWHYYYVAVYDSGCLQQGFAHIANRFNLDSYINQFYYNTELNRVEQILGREQSGLTTSVITNYEFAGKLTCEDLVN